MQFTGDAFCCSVLVACALTSKATLGLDFLEANHCSLEMAQRRLIFPEHGVSVSLCDSSTDPDLVLGQAILDEAIRIPPFSVMDVVAQVRGKAWTIQENKLKQLLVKVANGLVSSTNPQVPCEVAESESLSHDSVQM